MKSLLNVHIYIEVRYMFYKNQLAEEVTKYLSIIQAYVHMQNCKGLFDINKYCEDVFCGLLNIVYDLNLINLNTIDYNFHLLI